MEIHVGSVTVQPIVVRCQNLLETHAASWMTLDFGGWEDKGSFCIGT